MKWVVGFNVIWGHDGASWSGLLSVPVEAADRIEALRAVTAAIEGKTQFEIGSVVIGVHNP